MAANDSDAIKINNQLSACMSIIDTKISTESEIPALHFDLKINKPIAECGCKSALGSYAVHAFSEEYESYVLGGKIALMTSEHKILPLSTEQRLIVDKKLIIELSCAQPD